jgi:response regulator RpfG family c-di-GMP phosphodiesterase
VAPVRVPSGGAGIATAQTPGDEARRSVLIVDDEASVRHLMRRWLESRGYSVAVASNADEALELLAETPTAVALCDLRMPGRDGLWLTDQLRREHPDTAVIIATGMNDVSSTIEGLRRGIVDYLTKPFERDRLCAAVSRGVDWHRAALDARRWREQLELEMRTRRTHLQEVIASQFPDSSEDLDLLLATLTASTPEVYQHAHRVSALSTTIARHLGLAEAEVEIVERAALLHDVGKLTIPDAVLKKPAPLTLEEQRLVRLYPQIGYELLADVPYMTDAAPLVRHAQERLDGLGYPAGNGAGSIALGARIIAAADAFDVMIRPRVFRDAVSRSAALTELERCSGTQFDPAVVQAVVAIVDRD